MMEGSEKQKLNYIMVDSNTPAELQELLKCVIAEKLSTVTFAEDAKTNFSGKHI